MTKTIGGSYPNGYYFSAPYLSLSITASGSISGPGVYTGPFATDIYTLVNDGVIKTSQTSDGVYIASGGEVTNGGPGDKTAQITGSAGVRIAGNGGLAGTVVNYGAIETSGNAKAKSIGVSLGAGAVVNGTTTDTSADIVGLTGVSIQHAGSVVNYGFILAEETDFIGFEYPGYSGVYLGGGGSVTNGGIQDQAVISNGSFGVRIKGGAGQTSLVTNFGLISAAVPYADASGVYVAHGDVVNGTAADSSPSIIGPIGVVLEGAGTVTNYATIASRYRASGDDGVLLADGGAVINGAAADHVAVIKGGAGVLVQGAAGTVSNFGKIQGVDDSDAGVTLLDGGTITNGGATATGALIDGASGIDCSAAAATVINYGRIIGGVQRLDAGAKLGAGDELTNGAPGDRTALIEGYEGVSSLVGACTVTNFGTIEGAGGSAAYLEGGGTLTNGAAGDAGALIAGRYGMSLGGSVVLTNFGTISATRGDAVYFLTPGTLIVEAGSAFDGGVDGGGGEIEFASGAGVISGLDGGDLTVSGAMPSTAFDNFTTVEIGQGAAFTVTGAATVTALDALDDAGTLDVAATLSLAGAGDSFSGTLSGAGTVTFAAGTDALAGATLTVAHVKASGATVTLSGAVTNDSALGVSGGEVVVAAAGATLAGTGTVALSNSAANMITGATAGATLSLDQALEGAGKLGAGKLALIVQAAGLIESLGGAGLGVDTGTNTIANAGRIWSDSAGGLTIAGAVANAGVLAALAGTLAVGGAVTGTGHGRVAGGTLKFASSFNQNVDFDATGGTLELAHGQTYAGTLFGFLLTGATALDLDDIAFVSGTTKATYAGTANSGVLTVSSGSKVAHIHFAGDYLASVWTLSAGPGGGVTIVDPAKGGAHPAFVQAMAGTAPRPATAVAITADGRLSTGSTLISPRVQIA